MHEAMQRAGVPVEHIQLATPNGHDAFLLDYHLITPVVRDLLAKLS
ncbi:MAG: hypothetical protein WKG01_01505 [Kofleriaceae bacterium]